MKQWNDEDTVSVSNIGRERRGGAGAFFLSANGVHIVGRWVGGRSRGYSQ